MNTNERPVEDQFAGGALEIPKDWVVVRVNLDDPEPTVTICHKDKLVGADKVLPFPKPLAYYMQKHFCGSAIMHEAIRKDVRRSIAHKIADALGIEITTK